MDSLLYQVQQGSVQTNAESLNAAKCARRDSTVKSATRCSVALAAKIVSTVKSATSGSVLAAKIFSPVKSVMSNSAMIQKLPSIAVTVKAPSVLVADSRSLVTMNVSISFAPSAAEKAMLSVLRKAKRFYPQHPKYLALQNTDSQCWPHAFDLQVVPSTNTDRAHQFKVIQ
jgi:hypothetical protein